MEMWTLFVLAILPLFLIFLLMVFFKKSALFSLFLAWVSCLFISIYFWKINSNFLQGALLKGVFLALEISLILLGALVLLESVKITGCMKNIKKILKNITNDKRVLAIIIAWSFGVFIEGTAGFGTPALLAAPLLVGLGLSPLIAVVVSLISNSTPVAFGAMGTPVLLGLKNQISNSIMLSNVTVTVALIHAIIGTFIPLLVACIVSKYGKEKSFLKGFDVWKFAIFAGLCFTIPYFLLAYFIGPEFPSFLGGLIGLIVVVYSAHKGFLLKRKNTKIKKINLKYFLPYIIAASLLLISKIPFINNFLRNINFGFTNAFSSGIDYSFLFLLSPGFLFVLASMFTLLIFKKRLKEYYYTFSKSFPKFFSTFIVLLFATTLVQVYIYSGNNYSNLLSMPEIVASQISAFFGNFYTLISPFIGIFGSFITGSNTVSNLLFAPFQYQSAIKLSISMFLILALQNIGGSIGNMISPYNVIAASASVKLKGQEGNVIRKTLLPCLVYGILVGLFGLLIHLFL